MAFYSRGSSGPEVQRIQARLKTLEIYAGPIDGAFGGGTESAVKQFQSREDLDADGVIGAETWRRLFPRERRIAAPALLDEPLEHRTLALTGSFETSCGAPDCFAAVSGDFDGQGISLGALQWNVGQGTLQPLLVRMNDRHPDILEEIFHSHYAVLVAMLRSTLAEQLAWARAIQTPRRFPAEPWQGLFKTLGRRPEFHEIEIESAEAHRRKAEALCRKFQVKSERALALMFDIAVQNGGINNVVRAQILNDFNRIRATGDEAEVARLQSIARRRAEAANPRWVPDVLARKLTIANGKGTVHGRHYNLEEQYGITLRAM